MLVVDVVEVVVEVVEDIAQLCHQGPQPGSVVVVVLCVHPVTMLTPETPAEGADGEATVEPEGVRFKGMVVQNAAVEDKEDVRRRGGRRNRQRSGSQCHPHGPRRRQQRCPGRLHGGARRRQSAHPQPDCRQVTLSGGGRDRRHLFFIVTIRSRRVLFLFQVVWLPPDAYWFQGHKVRRHRRRGTPSFVLIFRVRDMH